MYVNSVVSGPIWTIKSSNDSHRSRGSPEHAPSSKARHRLTQTQNANGILNAALRLSSSRWARTCLASARQITESIMKLSSIHWFDLSVAMMGACVMARKKARRAESLLISRGSRTVFRSRRDRDAIETRLGARRTNTRAGLRRHPPHHVDRREYDDPLCRPLHATRSLLLAALRRAPDSDFVGSFSRAAQDTHFVRLKITLHVGHSRRVSSPNPKSEFSTGESETRKGSSRGLLGRVSRVRDPFSKSQE